MPRNIFKKKKVALLISLSLAAGVIQPGWSAPLNSLNGKDITLDNDSELIGNQSDGNGLYGVINPWGQTGAVSLGSRTSILVNDAEHHARGVQILADNSTLSADSLTVDVTGHDATGIELSGKKTQADLGTGSRVTVSGSGQTWTRGIQVSAGSSLVANGLAVRASGDNGYALAVTDYGSQANLGQNSQLSTTGEAGHALYVAGLNGGAINGPATLTASALHIETTGNNAYGINIQTGAEVNLGQNSTVTTSGAQAKGIWNHGQLTAGALSIDVTGSSAIGLEVREGGRATLGPNSHITSARGGALVASGNGATIQYSGSPEQRSSLYSGGSYAASAQSAGATVQLENTDLTIARSGGQGYGLWAMRGGQITGNDLTITGAAGNAGMVAMTGSEITLSGPLSITMASPDDIAIATLHNDGYDRSRISASGRMTINGSVLSQGGDIALDMSSGSLWSGSAFNDGQNGGTLAATLSNSRWDLSGDSQLSTLTLDNALVDFSAASAPAEYHTLHVGDLSGNGTLKLRVNMAGEEGNAVSVGDKLVIEGHSAGQYGLSFVNRGSLATTGRETLTVVESRDGAATFSTASAVELGGYLYTVQKQGTDWQLQAVTSEPAPPPKPDPQPGPEQDPVQQPDAPTDKPDAGGSAQLTSTANAGASLLAVNYLLDVAETQTLLQRTGAMGRDRGRDEDGNAWIRGFGGDVDAFSSGKLSGLSMRYSGTQFGVDKKLFSDKSVYAGVFMGMTRGSPRYASGSGTVQSQYAGLSATLFSDNGFYIDALTRFSTRKNQLSVVDSQQSTVSGYGRATAIGLAIESGKKISFGVSGNGFYVEPQTQLTAGRQNGSMLRNSNGLNIGLDRVNSLVGRASLVVGYEALTEDYVTHTYLKTGVIREFEGQTGYTLNGSAENHAFKGNWLNHGAGISATLKKQHTLYAEGTLSDGHQFRQKQFNAGYKFSF